MNKRNSDIKLRQTACLRARGKARDPESQRISKISIQSCHVTKQIIFNKHLSFNDFFVWDQFSLFLF